ncbi:hypothetical protein DIPPA_31830 [Diplonema papillatum]|nr:hypothetical protein DIPPA_31830 [Diplonema papillatum]
MAAQNGIWEAVVSTKEGLVLEVFEVVDPDLEVSQRPEAVRKLISERLEKLQPNAGLNLLRPEIRRLVNGKRVYSCFCFAETAVAETLMKASGRSGLFIKQLLSESTFDRRRKLDVVWLKDGTHEKLEDSLDTVQRSLMPHWGLVVSVKGFGVRVDPCYKAAALQAMNAIEHVPTKFYYVEGAPTEATRENVKSALTQAEWDTLPIRSLRNGNQTRWTVRAVAPPPANKLDVDGVVLTVTETARPPRYIDVIRKPRTPPRPSSNGQTNDVDTDAEVKKVRAEMQEVKVMVQQQAAENVKRQREWEERQDGKFTAMEAEMKNGFTGLFAQLNTTMRHEIVGLGEQLKDSLIKEISGARKLAKKQTKRSQQTDSDEDTDLDSSASPAPTPQKTKRGESLETEKPKSKAQKGKKGKN